MSTDQKKNQGPENNRDIEGTSMDIKSAIINMSPMETWKMNVRREMEDSKKC